MTVSHWGTILWNWLCYLSWMSDSLKPKRAILLEGRVMRSYRLSDEGLRLYSALPKNYANLRHWMLMRIMSQLTLSILHGRKWLEGTSHMVHLHSSARSLMEEPPIFFQCLVECLPRESSKIYQRITLVRGVLKLHICFYNDISITCMIWGKYAAGDFESGVKKELIKSPLWAIRVRNYPVKKIIYIFFHTFIHKIGSFQSLKLELELELKIMNKYSKQISLSSKAINNT